MLMALRSLSRAGILLGKTLSLIVQQVNLVLSSVGVEGQDGTTSVATIISEVYFPVDLKLAVLITTSASTITSHK